MRAKRSAILASLLLSMVATGWFGSQALLADNSSDAVYAGGPQASQVAAPPLANDPGAGSSIETRDASILGLLAWIATAIAFCVFTVSTILFRKEVATEKRLGRARQQRLSYYKDMRRYKEQMKGPPRHNT